MNAQARQFVVPILAAVAAAIPLAVAQAAPASSQTALTSADQLADATSRHDLNAAITQLSTHHRRAARDRLERAETALLNREVLDLGAALKPNRPLPQTPAIASIVKARTELASASHDLSRASQSAQAADQDVESELGPAS